MASPIFRQPALQPVGLTNSVVTAPIIQAALPSLMLFETLLSFGKARDPCVVLLTLNANFEGNLSELSADVRRQALILSISSIGSMVVASTLGDPTLQAEIMEAAQGAADDIAKSTQEGTALSPLRTRHAESS